MSDASKVRSWGTYLVRESLDKIELIENRFFMASSRQESYINQKIRDLDLMVEEQILLRVTPMKSLLKFKRNKLSMRYIGYVEINQRIGEVARSCFVIWLSDVYVIFHNLMLKKCHLGYHICDSTRLSVTWLELHVRNN